MRIVDQTEMKEIEQVTFNEFNLSESNIIECVGLSMARRMRADLLKEFPDATVLFLIGRGNNGADGLAVARHLTNLGYDVRAFLLAPKEKASEELIKQVELASQFGVKISEVKKEDTLESYFNQNMRSHIIVDAIYGTGTRLPLSNFDYSIIKIVNANSQYTVCLDLPSGVDPSSGHVQGGAIKADLTYAIGFPKVGCYVAEGSSHSGLIRKLNVGFPRSFQEKGNKFLAKGTTIYETVRNRNNFADKRIFGHTLVLGGSHGMTGALVLASQAALKVGAGLVTGATWEPQYQEFISRLMPEVMTGYIPTDESEWDKVLDGFKKYDSIVIGPGLGHTDLARRCVMSVLRTYQGPVVLDADALNVLKLKDDGELFQKRTSPTVMTPHYGEMARLLGVSKEEVFANPLEHLQNAVSLTNSYIILKGPCTFLGCPSGEIYFNYFPNSGMATGGAGDVLAGLLGGLLAQDRNMREKVSLYEKIVSIDKTVLMSILAHTRAGYYAAEELGERTMTASSIIDFLPKAFDEFENEST